MSSRREEEGVRPPSEHCQLPAAQACVRAVRACRAVQGSAGQCRAVLGWRCMQSAAVAAATGSTHMHDPISPNAFHMPGSGWSGTASSCCARCCAVAAAQRRGRVWLSQHCRAFVLVCSVVQLSQNKQQCNHHTR